MLADSAEVANWFTDGKRIGAPSANGLVAITSLRDAREIAVIKAPLQKNKQLDMVHEIYVATHGTNELRNSIPNFAYVYGGFQCSPSVFDSKGKLISLCGTGKEKTQYIIYETISPSVDFRSAITGDGGKVDGIDILTPESLFDAFLQVSLSTHMAWKKFDWTHYDLHSENVMLRRIPHHPDFAIKFNFEGRNIHIRSDRVATIIDFGYAHIKAGNKDFGYAIPSYGVFPDRSYPLQDIYKLLLFLASDAVEVGQDDLLDVLRKLYKYFSDEDIIDAVEKQGDYYYYLPEPLSEGKSLSAFIKYMFKTFPEYKEKVYSDKEFKDVPVLGCRNDCLTVGDVTRDLNNTKAVQDIIDVYEIYEDIRDPEILDQFEPNYPQAMERHIETWKNLRKITYNRKRKPSVTLYLQMK